MKIARPRFATRTIVIIGESQKALALAMIENLPIDPVRPLEVSAREVVKNRSLDANAAMWAGPLRDIAEQAWVQGRQYTAEVWHEHFKREYLPEEFEEDLCRAGYRKWDYLPNGERVLVGSTIKLTARGFALYLQSVEAFGAGMGVQFSDYERR
jgi:hypothetical protein